MPAGLARLRCLQVLLLAPLLMTTHLQIDATAASPSADPALDRQKGTVVFSGDWKYPPLSFLDENHRPAGFDVELFENIAAEAGWQAEIQLHDWNESLRLLAAGQVDVVPMFITPERARQFLFSEPFLRRYHLVFGRKGGRYVSSIDDLSGRRVAMQYARVSWDELHVAIPPVMIIPVSVESEALLAVARGDAEYALVPAAVGYDSITRHKLSEVVALSPPLLEGEYAYAISRRRPELVAQINAALRKVQASGRHDALYIEWLGNLRPAAESYRSGLLAGGWVALPLLASTLLVYIWWRRARRHAAQAHQRAETEARLRQEAQARIHHLAFHDPVSDLPNRNALQDLLHARATEAPHQGRRWTLARLDLVGLEMVQVVAGQELCDEVIRAIAQRLVKRFGSQCVAHLGREEFAVVLDNEGEGHDPETLASTFLRLVEERIQSGDLAQEPQCRVGLAQFPVHGATPQEVLRAAEMACAAAHKRNLRAVIYDRSLEPDPRNLTLLADLRQALREGTLGYALQPKLSLSKRRFSGAEMLVRWNHPKYGPLSPAVFVPLAEQTGIVGDMTLYLVKQALAHCREWEAQGLELSLSVNVSVNDLANRPLVDAILQEAQGVGHRLMLEVTETDVMRDTERVMDGIRRLRACGIQISLDDFGTGHASLTYLQRMAPDELKIDRSFISNLLVSASDQMIVRTSIQLAHDLGATVTAEGIEDDETLEWLASAGCDVAQGFGIARPMPLAELMNSPQLRHH